MTKAQQKSLEEEIEKFLPKKKANLEMPPYSELKSRPFGSHSRIEVDYIRNLFEQAPSEFEFTYAFKLFYDLKTGKDNAVWKENPKVQETLIKIPREAPRITAGIDTNKNYVHFTYRTGDKESEEIVDEFIKRLRE